jgi:acetyl esterase/lipase
VRRAALIPLLALAACGSHSAKTQVPSHPEKLVPHHAKTVKEVRRPARKPKGVMLIFSGGAWLAPPPAEVRTTRHYQKRYAALGWLAVDVGYRPGGQQSFADVTRAYDKAKAAHPGVPICAVGESSGGHLALMLAIARPLDCVEPVDAPVDLTKGLPKPLLATARAVFGKDLARWSPALHARQIHGEVLIVEAAGDQIVPPAQARQLEAALPNAKLIVLPNGGLPFIHDTAVDKSAYRRYLLAERAFLAQAR